MTKILCIDDDANLLLTIKDYLLDEKFDAYSACSGAEGISLFHKNKPDVVVTDLRMAGGDGFLVLEHVTQESPVVPVIVLSGTGCINDVVKCMKIGAWDFLLKPLKSLNKLKQSIQDVLKRSELKKLELQRICELENINHKFITRVSSWIHSKSNSVQQLESPLAISINSLNLALREKDPYTAGHNERVAAFAVIIGETMGLGKHEQETLRTAGLLHDIGKIAIPKEILNKRGSLAPDEFEQIRSHVGCGYRILKDIPFAGPVAEAVLQHHERYDGTGYPHGLAGRQILLEARILAVADVFEALCSDRPYRAGLDPTYVANYMIKNSGTHFCPECIAAFKGLFFDADIFACN